MKSLREGYRAVVVGASGGLGAALTRQLADDPGSAEIIALARDVARAPSGEKIVARSADIADEGSIKAAFSDLKDLDLVIVATGVLHGPDGLSPEKSLRRIKPDDMATVFAINTIGPAVVAREALPKLNKSDRAMFAAISARVGSIGDNRLGGWHSYRASKAALNMLLRNFAIEMARLNKTSLVVGLHPGTVDTALSAPFQSNVAEGKLFAPDYSAERMLSVLDGLGSDASGSVFAWDGQRIPE